jgi:fatty acid desaturase
MERPLTRRPWVEAPTLILICACYAVWVLVTLAHASIPGPLLACIGACVLTLHGSLQHEAIHGHPSGNTRLDALLVGVPLSLWLPYPVYRASHLRHHASNLTDPLDDPESAYVDAATWSSWPRWRRAWAQMQRTLAGRLLLGPIDVTLRLWAAELRAIVDGDRSRLPTWIVHALSMAAVIVWLELVCGMPLWLYLVAFVYPGISLTLLRSFAEHRVAADPAHRSVIVEAHPLWGLLFLSNNLHAVHHRWPGLPWYAIAPRYRRHRELLLRQNGGYRLAGYAEVFRRWAWRRKDAAVHVWAR